MSADVLEVVDISPEQLIKRLKAGKVYKKDRLDVAFSNFFTYAHLSELRTLTLRTVADLMSDKEKSDTTIKRHSNLILLWQLVGAFIMKQ